MAKWSIADCRTARCLWGMGRLSIFVVHVVRTRFVGLLMHRHHKNMLSVSPLAWFDITKCEHLSSKWLNVLCVWYISMQHNFCIKRSWFQIVDPFFYDALTHRATLPLWLHQSACMSPHLSLNVTTLKFECLQTWAGLKEALSNVRWNIIECSPSTFV